VAGTTRARAILRDDPPKGAIMAWIYLGLAGLLEILWAFTMKKSAGFTLLWPSVITIIGAVASMVVLSLAMKTLPLGTAYTVWTGIGAVGAFLLGILVLGEAATPLRIIAALLIVTGLILMKLAGGE
jgi:quaternary ammonium compound-resistance protein SugE